PAAASTGNSRTAIGYAEASQNFASFPATFSGQTLNDNPAVLMRYVLSGDADLSGTVDTIDFNLLATNFSQSGKKWFDGDFDYNGTVDTIDFNLLASNFSLSLAAPAAGNLVPEPLCALSMFAGLLLRARR